MPDLTRRQLPLVAAAIASAGLSARTHAASGIAPDLAYTAFSRNDPRAAFVEPPAPVGTVAYNLWLGTMFNGVLFNTPDATGQARIAARIVHRDYLQHNLLVAQGRQGILDFMPYLFKAMPDTRFILHEVIATTDRVVTRWTWTGTLTGEGFLGVAPRGQRIEFDGIDIWTVKDGLLYEHWDQFDWPRALIQIGLGNLPAPFYDVARRPYSR